MYQAVVQEVRKLKSKGTFLTLTMFMDLVKRIKGKRKRGK